MSVISSKYINSWYNNNSEFGEGVGKVEPWTLFADDRGSYLSTKTFNYLQVIEEKFHLQFKIKLHFLYQNQFALHGRDCYVCRFTRCAFENYLEKAPLKGATRSCTGTFGFSNWAFHSLFLLHYESVKRFPSVLLIHCFNRHFPSFSSVLFGDVPRWVQSFWNLLPHIRIWIWVVV